MERLISRTHAAEMLGVSKQTISNYVERGILKGHYISDKGEKYLMLDRNTVMGLVDNEKDLQTAKKKLDAIKAEYEKKAARLEKEDNELSLYSLYVKEHPIDRGTFAVIRSLAFKFLRYAAGATLDQRSTDVVGMLIEGYSLNDIASEYDLTRERVRQILFSASRKLAGTRNLCEIDEENKKLKDEVSELKDKLAAAINKINALSIDKGCSTITYEPDLVIRLVPILRKRLVDCDISVRALNATKYLGVDTVGALASSLKADLLNARNFGKKSLAELTDLLYSFGLDFGMDVDGIYSQYDFIKSVQALGNIES